jgi:predicted kinase
MEELIVKFLIGVPASGKSTWAKEYVKKNKNWVRFNRDDMRFMLKDMPICEPKMEALISELQENVITTALSKRLNVLIDNTNLKPEYIDAIIKLVQHTAKIEFQIFDISLEKAIERDNNREKKVGEEVIKRMFKDYKKILDSFDFSTRSKVKYVYSNPTREEELPDAVICDIDGTLAHMNGKRGPFDWEKVDRDDLDEIVANLIKMHHSSGTKVLMVSGRDGSCRELTEDWLKFYAVPYDKLYMRPVNDFRKDTLIKKEIYEKNIKGKYNVLAVYDDRDQVVKMWRSLGLKVLQVAEGKF